MNYYSNQQPDPEFCFWSCDSAGTSSDDDDLPKFHLDPSVQEGSKRESGGGSSHGESSSEQHHRLDSQKTCCQQSWARGKLQSCHLLTRHHQSRG